MQKKFWICLALLLVIPGMLFTVSCQKKTVKADSSVSTQPVQAETKAAEQQAAAEQQKKEEEIQQRLAEEQRLSEERLREKRLREERLQAEYAAAAKAKEMKEKSEKMAFLVDLVLFDYDSSSLTPTAQDILNDKAAWLRNNPKVKVIIEGHCDERGSVEYNLALGERRAEAAKAFLIDLGIDGSRLTTISYGKERPFATGHNEASWRLNRRAHFVIE
jgi:peptidoglycan-associated lipoprotein